jgi:chorismate lyase / 3-hydroxybenzoate synthase
VNAVPSLMPDTSVPRLWVEYISPDVGIPHGSASDGGGHPDLAALLARDDTLAVLGFGTTAPISDDPRYLRVPLEPAGGAAPFEVWRSSGQVSRGATDDGNLNAIRHAEDGALQFGVLELDERDGIEATAAAAYARITAFVRARGYPHMLRSWNYLDAITEGHGDEERYRRFCVGRAAGLGLFYAGTLPAASALGRRDGVRTLQVYWLAARTAGTPLENPRQLSAYRYPRDYGPTPPSFARAMLPPGAEMPLLLSGTASIVGHESRHHDCIESQLLETFANFDSLIAAARAQRPTLPPRFGSGSRLKVYVRDREQLPRVAAALDSQLGPTVPRILLHAAICRRELQVEIDGFHA